VTIRLADHQQAGPQRPASVRVERLGPALGAEVSGVDLSRPLPDPAVDVIRAALAEHGVVFFRDQPLTPEQHVAFAERFGQVNVNRFFRQVDGHPKIAEVRKEAGQRKNIGGDWHTDHSYDQVPALGSVLLAREVPAEGGDTVFASMYAAYDALSDGLKETLGRLRAVHSSRHVFGVGGRSDTAEFATRLGNREQAVQDAIHPVVIRHPESGRPALYVNPGFTIRFEGWTEEESRPLLEHLYRHAVRPEFLHRFTWRPGSIAFWDNRSTWHYAVNDYQGERRLMHRITLEGVPLQ
jgi:taurine dioxygenase